MPGDPSSKKRLSLFVPGPEPAGVDQDEIPLLERQPLLVRGAFHVVRRDEVVARQDADLLVSGNIHEHPTTDDLVGGLLDAILECTFPSDARLGIVAVVDRAVGVHVGDAVPVAVAVDLGEQVILSKPRPLAPALLC